MRREVPWLPSPRFYLPMAGWPPTKVSTTLWLASRTTRSASAPGAIFPFFFSRPSNLAGLSVVQERAHGVVCVNRVGRPGEDGALGFLARGVRVTDADANPPAPRGFEHFQSAFELRRQRQYARRAARRLEQAPEDLRRRPLNVRRRVYTAFLGVQEWAFEMNAERLRPPDLHRSSPGADDLAESPRRLHGALKARGHRRGQE